MNGLPRPFPIYLDASASQAMTRQEVVRLKMRIGQLSTGTP
jgi:hypothetical protein